MKGILKFLIEVGKLKNIKRRGIMFYGVKDAETTAEHSFRMTIVAWILGEIANEKGENLNLEKVIKMALCHDLCEVYSGDITPYDGLLPKDKKEREKFVRKWLRLPQKEKKKRYEEKFKKEYKAIKKLISYLPDRLKKEIHDLWLEYEKRLSPEARFVHQIDRIENLLEAFQCFKENENFPTRPWWEHAEEVIDNKVLLEFLKEIEKEELKIKKKRKK